MNKSLENFVKKRLNQGTIILCFKIMLDEVIKNGRDSTLTKSEIHKKFDSLHKGFGIGTFRSDYLLRQTTKGSDNVLGVESDNSTYFIQEKYLENTSDEELSKLSYEISEHYRIKVGIQNEFLNNIRLQFEKSLDEQKAFIIEMLSNIEADKKGQAFEVTSFAILKTFYSVRGFELNRFSTIYSNDGGIDFTSQQAVYQVTTDLSQKKFDEDLIKAPLKKRIFVYKKQSGTFDNRSFDNDLVLDYINLEDLISHLEYLLEKKPKQNIHMILDIIISEFEREYYV